MEALKLTSTVDICTQATELYFRTRDGNSLDAFNQLEQFAQLYDNPLAHALVMICHLLGYAVVDDEELAKSLAPACVPWLRQICTAPERKWNPLFPIAAYPYSLCIYYELDTEKRELDRYWNLLQEAMSVHEYPYLLHSVAHAHQFGHGTPVDGFHAIKFYRKAKDMGFAISAHNLGDCFFEGEGTKKDQEMAFQLFQESITMGYLKAYGKIGNCYFYGTGVSRDYTQAVAYYKLAAELRLGSACYMLAFCYQNYIGVPSRDYNAAEVLARKGMEVNHSGAMYLLCTLLLERDYLPSHVTEVISTKKIMHHIEAVTIMKKIISKKDYMYEKTSLMLGLHYLGHYSRDSKKAVINAEEAIKLIWGAVKEHTNISGSNALQPRTQTGRLILENACLLRHFPLIKFLVEKFDPDPNHDIQDITARKQCFMVMFEIGMPLIKYRRSLPIHLAIDCDMLLVPTSITKLDENEISFRLFLEAGFECKHIYRCTIMDRSMLSEMQLVMEDFGWLVTELLADVQVE